MFKASVALFWNVQFLKAAFSEHLLSPHVSTATFDMVTAECPTIYIGIIISSHEHVAGGAIWKTQISH